MSDEFLVCRITTQDFQKFDEFVKQFLKFTGKDQPSTKLDELEIT